ncbi:hypothetical protein ACS0TY_030010 [Phlomoides rotata]
MACCILHNFIRREMTVDPLEDDLDDYLAGYPMEDPGTNVDVVETLETTDQWTNWRDSIAQEMFNKWVIRQ